MKNLATRAFTRVARIGEMDADDPDVRLRKSMLVLCSFPFIFIGFAWGAMYAVFGELLTAAIPFSYGVISLLSIIHFGKTGRYDIFRFSQLSLILILPFLVMLSLGGFVGGSAVILWAFVCPVGAMLFEEPRAAPRWYLAFLGLVVLSGLLEPVLNIENGLSPGSIAFFFVVNVLGVSAVIFAMVFYFVSQKNVFQNKAEALLLNILPREIVAILRDDHRTIADHYDAASVLFADVVGFTRITAEMSPTELVKLLDDVFSKFDKLADLYGVEKIKTIGDCYMVAAGVPQPRDDHAHVLTQMALEMRDFSERHEVRGHKLTFRIGLNSGPVVAGVIGHRKFSYDLWGDVVNTASRMEAYGQPGSIQITRATYDLINHDFECQSRGTIDVKGKGPVAAWFVVGPSPAMG